jgi:hypothetical protein
MYRGLTIAACCWTLCAVHAAADPAGIIELANDHITLVVQPPNGEHGEYGNARFDWAGVVSYVEANGHTFIGGKNPDGSRRHSLGTIGEFVDTLGFEENADGQTTRGIRIGVGQVEIAYPKSGTAETTLVEPAGWIVLTLIDEVSHVQNLRHNSGYGYEYVKTVALVPDAAAFTIRHDLRNTGVNPITTRTYVHNWLLIDDTPVTGEHYRVRFNYDIKPTQRNFPQLQMNLVGREIAHDPSVPMAKGLYYAEFTPFEKVEQNAVVVENLKTGASMRITGDWAPGWYHVYITKDDVSPEPFLQLDLKPGEARSWTVRYDCIVP